MMQERNSHRDAPVRRRSVANAHVAHPSGRGAAVASGESANAEDAPVKRTGTVKLPEGSVSAPEPRERRASGRTSGEAAGRTSGRASGEVAGRTSGRASGRASGEVAGRVVGETTGRAAGKAASKVPAENESSSTAQKTLRKVGRTVKPVALKVYDALSPLNPASFDLRRRVAIILAAVVLVVTLAGAIMGGNAGSLQAEVADQQAQYDQLQSSNEQTQTALDNREKALKDYYG